MIEKRLSDITLSDIRSLIDNEVGEKKTLEYKRELHLDTAEARKEFLADVTSLANADGGDLIYGIEEDGGTNLPTALPGIPIENEDKLILQLEGMLQNGVSPRIPSVLFKVLPLKKGTGVLLLRMDRSYSAPHRVTHSGHDRFYTRNAKGKYPMDVEELRTAFIRSQGVELKMEEYKLRRLEDIREDRYRFFSEGAPKLVLQLLPVAAFATNNLYSVSQIQQAAGPPRPGEETKITLEGLIRIDRTAEEDRATGYRQFYKKGMMEQVAKKAFYRSANGPDPQVVHLIHRAIVATTLINFLEMARQYYRRLELHSPVVVSCAIVGGNGYTLDGEDGSYSSKQLADAIDRELLPLPDTYWDDPDGLTIDGMQWALDGLWNACGYPRCPFYDADGRWIFSRG